MKETLTLWGYTLGWQLMRALPASVAYAGARRIADRMYLSDGVSVQRLRLNLSRVLSATRDAPLSEEVLEDAVRAGVRSYARYWLEAFRLPSWSREEILSNFRCENEELLTSAYSAGKGVVVALPHAGNWDHAGAWGTLQGYPLVTVAERVKPEKLYRKFLRYREALGIEILALTGERRSPVSTLVDRVRAGHVAVLVADRDMSRAGIQVPFFGDTISVPAGPALIAQRTGAPLLTASLWYEDGKTCARLNGPLDVSQDLAAAEAVEATSRAMAENFERGIAQHPIDWHMLQWLWREDRAQRRMMPRGSTVHTAV